MFNGAKSDRIKIGNTVMEYITFGKGDKTLVIIPGLSDGLKTVKGTAMTMALMYRKYAKEYKVFVFSRKNQLEEGYDTRHMARDLKEAMAEGGDYKNLVIDSMEKTYTEDYLKRKKYRWMYPVITRIGKPKDFNRFIIQAKACLNHSAYEEIGKIQCPTLVIGGDTDNVVGINTSEEMAERIPGSRLVIYPSLGHGAYAESKEFDREVLKFLS